MSGAAEESRALALLAPDAAVVLTSREKFEAFFAAIAAEARSHVPDLTTVTGRKAVAANAYKVTRTKTAIDDARKRLTEDARKQIKAVNEEGARIRDKLENLAAEVRDPLTQWEAEEAARERMCGVIIAEFKAAGIIQLDDTSKSVSDRLCAVEAISVIHEQFRDSLASALAAKTAAVEALRAGHARLLQEEADRAELERLRAEAAKRAEEDAKRAAEAEDERRKLEQERLAAEQLQAAKEQAAEAARIMAERAAAHAREAQERRHAEELQRLRDEQAQQQLIVEAARKRREQAEAAAALIAERKAKEEADRAADRTHRGEVMRRAKEALMKTAKLDEGAARDVILAIAAGNVPGLHIEF